jgi:hypothetical protein
MRTFAQRSSTPTCHNNQTATNKNKHNKTQTQQHFAMPRILLKKTLDSYQVLNADGMDTRQIRLPRKRRSFSRAPWIVRKLHSTKVVSYLHDHEEALVQTVQEAIEELKKRKHPSYRDVLQPLFSIFPVMANITSSSSAVAAPSGRLLANYSDLVSLIATKSAEFLNHSRAQQEARLLTPRGHYRALTNYWAYLIVGYCLDHNNHDDDDRFKMVYAYSFIYPYMDDLLDKQNSSKSFQSGKKKLITNITHQIESGKIPDTMAFAECGDQDELERERRIYELLDQVLSSQSSSSSNPATPLQESLLAVNMAQRASLQQHMDWTDLRAGVMAMPKSQKQLVWQISIHKGVSSILPNAYFYAPAGITKEQAEMVAVIGYMGQFLNDIEGLHEDEAEKSLTPALISFLKHGTLDRFVERCWAHLQILLRSIGNRFPTLSRDRIEVLLRLMTVRLLATTAMMHQ